MASNIYYGSLHSSTSARHVLAKGELKCDCKDMFTWSHYAIIAKGNILDGIEAKE